MAASSCFSFVVFALCVGSNVALQPNGNARKPQSFPAHEAAANANGHMSGRAQGHRVSGGATEVVANVSCHDAESMVLKPGHVVFSNLGGTGPDREQQPMILIKDVFTRHKSIFLEVSNTSEYRPGTGSSNGLQHCFAKQECVADIGVDPGTEVKLKFRFLDGRTLQPKAVGPFHFSVLSLAQGHGDVQFSPFASYTTSHDTKVTVKPERTFHSNAAPHHGPHLFSAPSFLAHEHGQDSVSFLLPAVSTFELKYHAHGNVAQSRLAFAGRTSLACPAGSAGHPGMRQQRPEEPEASRRPAAHSDVRQPTPKVPDLTLATKPLRLTAKWRTTRGWAADAQPADRHRAADDEVDGGDDEAELAAAVEVEDELADALEGDQHHAAAEGKGDGHDEVPLPPAMEEVPALAQHRLSGGGAGDAGQRGHAGDICRSSVMLDINDDRVIFNNLGGLGPHHVAEHGIRYRNVFPWSKKSVDLVIKNTSTYAVENSRQENGVLRHIGSIGVLRQGAAPEVKLKFMFVNHHTNESVKVPAFLFSFVQLRGVSYARMSKFEDALRSEHTVVQEISDGHFHSHGVNLPPWHPWAPHGALKLDAHEQSDAVTFAVPALTNRFWVTLGLRPGQSGTFRFAGATSLACTVKRPGHDQRGKDFAESTRRGEDVLEVDGSSPAPESLPSSTPGVGAHEAPSSVAPDEHKRHTTPAPDAGAQGGAGTAAPARRESHPPLTPDAGAHGAPGSAAPGSAASAKHWSPPPSASDAGTEPSVAAAGDERSPGAASAGGDDGRAQDDEPSAAPAEEQPWKPFMDAGDAWHGDREAEDATKTPPLPSSTPDVDGKATAAPAGTRSSPAEGGRPQASQVQDVQGASGTAAPAEDKKLPSSTPDVDGKATAAPAGKRSSPAEGGLPQASQVQDVQGASSTAAPAEDKKLPSSTPDVDGKATAAPAGKRSSPAEGGLPQASQVQDVQGASSTAAPAEHEKFPSSTPSENGKATAAPAGNQSAPRENESPQASPVGDMQGASSTAAPAEHENLPSPSPGVDGETTAAPAGNQSAHHEDASSQATEVQDVRDASSTAAPAGNNSLDNSIVHADGEATATPAGNQSAPIQEESPPASEFPDVHGAASNAASADIDKRANSTVHAEGEATATPTGDQRAPVEGESPLTSQFHDVQGASSTAATAENTSLPTSASDLDSEAVAVPAENQSALGQDESPQTSQVQDVYGASSTAATAENTSLSNSTLDVDGELAIAPAETETAFGEDESAEAWDAQDVHGASSTSATAENTSLSNSTLDVDGELVVAPAENETALGEDESAEAWEAQDVHGASSTAATAENTSLSNSASDVDGELVVAPAENETALGENESAGALEVQDVHGASSIAATAENTSLSNSTLDVDGELAIAPAENETALGEDASAEAWEAQDVHGASSTAATAEITSLSNSTLDVDGELVVAPAENETALGENASAGAWEVQDEHGASSTVATAENTSLPNSTVDVDGEDAAAPAGNQSALVEDKSPKASEVRNVHGASSTAAATEDASLSNSTLDVDGELAIAPAEDETSFGEDESAKAWEEEEEILKKLREDAVALAENQSAPAFLDVDDEVHVALAGNQSAPAEDESPQNSTVQDVRGAPSSAAPAEQDSLPSFAVDVDVEQLDVGGEPILALAENESEPADEDVVAPAANQSAAALDVDGEVVLSPAEHQGGPAEHESSQNSTAGAAGELPDDLRVQQATTDVVSKLPSDAPDED